MFYLKKINKCLKEMTKFVNDDHHDMAAVRLLDAFLKAFYQIAEHSNDPEAAALASRMLDARKEFDKRSHYKLMDCIW
jgi:citrate synthase